VIGAESTCGFLLRDFDSARRLEQAVESAGGRGRFSEEEIDSVELAEVADPVRLEDRFSARHRKRMECSDWSLRILLQVVEVWRLETIGDRVKNTEMDFERLFDLIEDAAQACGLGIRRDFFYLAGA